MYHHYRDRATLTLILAPIDHREATRLISASQFGSGAWLDVAPDASLPFTRPRSGPYTIALQRRFGLYIGSARGANSGSSLYIYRVY